MVSGLALLGIPALLGGAVAWLRPAYARRLASSAYLLALLTLLGLGALLSWPAFVAGVDDDVLLVFLFKLAVALYTLLTVLVLLLELAWFDLLDNSYLVLARGGLILWVLLMRSLWVMPMSDVLTGIEFVFPSTESYTAVQVLGWGVVLGYQLLGIGLGIVHWGTFSPKRLLAALLFLQVGLVLGGLLPALRQPIWLAVFAAPLLAVAIYQWRVERRTAA